MDSDEELFIENKTRLRSSFEQLILKYGNVSSQEIEEYDLNTGEGYIIPNPLDPSLRSISHNAEDLWKFPDFKDFVPENTQTEDEEINDISASNSENEDNISSDSGASSEVDEGSDSEEEIFSSEAELSEAENIETSLDSQPFEDEINSKTNFSRDYNEANSISLKDGGSPSYTTKFGANSLPSEDAESDFGTEVPPLDAKPSNSDYPESSFNSIHCKNEINLKTKHSEESKENDSVNLKKESKNQKSLTSKSIKKNVHRVERNSNPTSSNKRHRSTLKYSKSDSSKTESEIEKSLSRKFEEADSLDDVGPILVDWKLDISYSDSESSSDEKDTPSSTQGDKNEKACSKNNQIIIESTEKLDLNDDSNLETDEKPVPTKRRSKKISSKSISKADKVDNNKADEKPVTAKIGPKRKSKGISIAAVELLTSKPDTKVEKIDDNSESKACDGIKCEKMFCLMCDSLNL